MFQYSKISIGHFRIFMIKSNENQKLTSILILNENWTNKWHMDPKAY